MDFLTFDQLQARLQELYGTGNATAALDLLSTQTPNFPEYQPLLVYWQSVLEAHLGNPDRGLRLLNTMLEQGIWYSEALLRKSPTFKGLQDDPQFQLLLARNQALHEADPTVKIPVLTVRPANRCRPGGPPCPLLFALHANYASAHSSLPFWQPAASLGWMVAALQSSQALWRGASIWNDRQVAREEAQRLVAAAKAQIEAETRRARGARRVSLQPVTGPLSVARGRRVRVGGEVRSVGQAEATAARLLGVVGVRGVPPLRR